MYSSIALAHDRKSPLHITIFLFSLSFPKCKQLARETAMHERGVSDERIIDTNLVI